MYSSVPPLGSDWESTVLLRNTEERHCKVLMSKVVRTGLPEMYLKLAAMPEAT